MKTSYVTKFWSKNFIFHKYPRARGKIWKLALIIESSRPKDFYALLVKISQILQPWLKIFSSSQSWGYLSWDQQEAANGS